MFAVFQTFLIALIKDKTLIIILLWETKKIKMKQKKINIPDFSLKVLLIKRYFGACFSVCMQSIKLTFQQVGALAKWLDCPVASLSSLLQPWPAKPWGHSLRMEFRSLRSAGFNWKYEKIGDIILVEGGFCHDLTKIQVRFATTWQNHIFCESHWICISDVAFHSLFHHVSPDWEDSDGKARVLGSTSLKFLPFIHWSMVRWMNHND